MVETRLPNKVFSLLSKPQITVNQPNYLKWCYIKPNTFTLPPLTTANELYGTRPHSKRNTTAGHMHTVELLAFLFASLPATETPTTQTKVLNSTTLTARKKSLKYSRYTIPGTESI